MANRGFQYVTDEKGRKTAVILDLRRHARIWEDVYDSMVVEARRGEPRVDWEDVKRRLRAKPRRG